MIHANTPSLNGMPCEKTPSSSSAFFRARAVHARANLFIVNIMSLSTVHKPATLARIVAAEAAGTFVMMLLGVGAVVIDGRSGGSITHVGISLVWGAAVAVVIYSLGHISGAHLNAAVTISSAALGRFPWRHVPLYVATQVAACTAAAAALRGVFGNVGHMAATVPADGISVVQALATEVASGFCLMLISSGACSDPRAPSGFSGLVMGLTVFALVAVAGPVSGASLNPARTIGSAIAGNKYTSIWIYMTGPTLGCLLGGFFYELVRTEDPEHPSSSAASFPAVSLCCVDSQPQTTAADDVDSAQTYAKKCVCFVC